MKIEDSVISIADAYDTFFVDIYGVLFDGAALFEGALSTLEKLRSMGKKVTILSNVTQTSAEAQIGYHQRGMIKGVHYDRFVTSGEFLRHTIVNDYAEFSNMIGKNVETFKCMFIGNDSIFKETSLRKTTDGEEADFLYIGVPRISYGAVRVDDVLNEAGHHVDIENIVSSDWHKLTDSQGRNGFGEFARQLEACLKKNKIIVVANPDIFAHGTLDHTNNRYPIVTQGCIGAYYEKLGGKTIYFGKPFRGIFEYAKQFVDSKFRRIVMIGDTPWTDVVGANSVGIDSLMVMTGIPTELCKDMSPSLKNNEKLKILFDETAPRMMKSEFSFRPTHIAKRFADLH